MNATLIAARLSRGWWFGRRFAQARTRGGSRVVRQVLARLLPLRVPVSAQMCSADCGAACLTMVVAYHGRKVTLADCRERCGVGRDGASAFTLVQAGECYGLRARALSISASLVGELSLPCILHWDFNHFVVLERCTARFAVIVDPAFGRRRVAREELAMHFSGVALTFAPLALDDSANETAAEDRAPELSPARRSLEARRLESRSLRGRSVVRFLTMLLRMPGARSLLVKVLAASFLLQALGLVVPIVTKVLIDDVLPAGSANLMSPLGLGIVVLVVAQAATVYSRAVFLIRLEARLDSKLMIGFFEHVLSLPYRYFQQRASGDLLMRLGSNAVIRDILTNQTVSVLLDGALVSVYLVILLAVAPSFGLLVLVLGALQVTVLLGSIAPMHGLMQRELAAQAESQGYLVEALTGIATLKACGGEERALEHWTGLFTTHLSITMRRGYLCAVIDTIVNALNTMAPLLLLWVGAFQVLGGSMTLGTMLALVALATAFLAPLSSLVSTGLELQRVGAHLERIRDVIDAVPEQASHALLETPALEGRIQLEDVSFAYQPSAPQVLEHISLSIEPGEKIAIVGRTGSGKSTLAMLLLGLYAPSAGRILYDNRALAQLDYRQLRRQLGVALQSPFLFSGSIAQNIAFGTNEVSRASIEAAAKVAAIHEDIAQMPMGYETRVGEGGVALSGGQRQRLAIARALVTEPRVLLLDEATSHLDVLTEARVDRALSALACTRVVIAHRLSTVRNADQIFVLDRGTIVERGSHATLLALGGHYSALVRGQSDASQHADVVSV